MAANVQKIFQFLKEVRFELKRVTWPTRKETLAGTVVVLIIVFIAAFFLGIVDIGLSELIKMILSR
jgi:preprotein translocase subunit SecE